MHNYDKTTLPIHMVIIISGDIAVLDLSRSLHPAENDAGRELLDHLCELNDYNSKYLYCLLAFFCCIWKSIFIFIETVT